MEDYEKTFKEFWLDKVTTDGTLDLDRVIRKLHDYKHLLDNVPKVYDVATGGRLSKVMYDADTVLDAIREQRKEERDFWYEEGVKDTEEKMYSNL